eukprot:1162054-Pelagomonas_calceolata.AAC.5
MIAFTVRVHFEPCGSKCLTQPSPCLEGSSPSAAALSLQQSLQRRPSRQQQQDESTTCKLSIANSSNSSGNRGLESGGSAA